VTARIAVAGTGWWSTNHHLPALEADPRAAVVAVVDPDPRARAAAADRFGVTRTHDDVEELLQAGGVDGLVVATPHSSHYDVAARAVDAGVHVLVEKPMTLSADDAWRLVHRAAEREVQVTVGYEHQHTRHAALARKIVQSQQLGPLELVSALCATSVQQFYRGEQPDGRPLDQTSPEEGPAATTYSDPATAGGGQGQTQVTHTMGMVVHVTGVAPVQVAAVMADADLDVDVVDAMTFRLEGGALGTVSATGNVRHERSARHEVRYYCRDGFLVQSLSGGSLELHDYRRGGEPELLVTGEPQPTQAPAQCLVDLCLGGASNPAPGEEGARVVEFLEAAYRSAQDGRMVVLGRR
jgi:predicted dehydrogenase